MFRKTLCGLAGVLSMLVTAQEPLYRWGAEATNDFPERRVDRLLDLGDQGFVLLRVAEDATTVKHFWLEHFDRDLRSVGLHEVAFNNGVMGNAYFLDEVLAINGGLYAMVSHWDKAAGKHSLAVHGLGFDGRLGDGVVLDAIAAEKMGNRGNFRWAHSPDGSKLLVLAELPYTKDAQEGIRLSCYDVPAFTKRWQEERSLEWKADKAPDNRIAVDDRGQAYLFKSSWQKPNWEYALYASDGKGTWHNHRPSGIQGGKVLDHRLLVGPDGHAFLYALYTLDPSNYTRKVHGSWYARFGTDGSIQADRRSDWGADMAGYFSGERNAAKGELSYVDDLHIKDILFRANGDPQLVLERMRHDSKPVPGSSPMQFAHVWQYGDAITLPIKAATGEPYWWQTVTKRQEAKGSVPQDEFGSFVYHLKGDRLFILWNNTALSVPSIPPAGWTEADGTRYVKHKAFDSKTVHATFLQVVEPDGKLAYGDRTHGLPLFQMHQGAAFEMSMTTPFFFTLNGDLVVLAMMHNGGKRYRFGFIGL